MPNLTTTQQTSLFPSSYVDLFGDTEFGNILLDLRFATKNVTNTNDRINKDITQIDSFIGLRDSTFRDEPYVPY
jgi:hypothetical protein